MKLFTVNVTESDLSLNDKALADKVRSKVIAEIDRQNQVKIAAHASKIAKMGKPITIDGVVYLTRKEAREALGLTTKQFTAKYGYAFDV